MVSEFLQPRRRRPRACFVVGDYRDKRGFYRNFPGETIAAFTAAGAWLYNEAILVTAAGSLPIRAGKQFSSSRKLGKTHQNVLVFCKGDPRKATEACGPVEIDDALFDDIRVVRDDLFPGGTKARFAGPLFDGADEVVYASPAEGGAQTALAIIAEQLGKRATVFVAKRQVPHARALMAKAHGAKVYQVSPGY